MPLPFFDFGQHNQGPINNGLGDVFENYYKGQELAQTPSRLAQQKLARELQNSLFGEQITGAQQQNQYYPQIQEQALRRGELENQYYPQIQESMLALNKAHQGLYGAQTQKAGMPEHGDLVKAIMDAQQVKQLFPDDPRMHELADAFVQRKAEGAPGMQLDFDPETGAMSFSQGGKTGAMQQVVDGKLVSKPGAAATNKQQSASLAKSGLEFLNKNIKQPYLGSGSNKKLLQDLNAYKKETDLNKKQEIGDRLIDATVAFKILPEHSGLALSSENVSATIPAIEHQTKALTKGWPETLDIVTSNLPPELTEAADTKYKQTLQDMNDYRSQHFARGLPIDLNKMKPKNEMVSITNRKTGETKMVTAEEAEKLIGKKQ